MIWIITIYGQFQKTDKPVMLCYMEWPWIVITGIMIIERLCKIMAECIFCQRKEKQGTNMKLQQLMSYSRRAIDDYSLIEEGDHDSLMQKGGVYASMYQAQTISQLAYLAERTVCHCSIR